MKFSKTTVGSIALATATTTTATVTTSATTTSTTTITTHDAAPDWSFVQRRRHRRRLQRKQFHRHSSMRKNFNEDGSLRLVNTDNANKAIHNDVGGTDAANGADTGILQMGGMATYGTDSGKETTISSSNGSGRDTNDRRWLQPDLTTRVKNTNLLLGDFNYTDLDYLTDEYIEYMCSNYCECTNATDSLNLSFCLEKDKCDEYSSKCGQPSTECNDWEGTFVIDDYSNFRYSGCIIYTVPYDDFTWCTDSVIEDAIVTSCNQSINGVKCESCTIEPTFGIFEGTFSSYPYLRFCYVSDCTNTDLAMVTNDCFWSNYSPIKNVHKTAGCVESCDICPGETGGIGNPEAVVENIDAFASTELGVDTCAGLIDLGLTGYFTADECTDLQGALPDPCGCTTVPAEPGNTTIPTTMEPTTMAPSAATPNHVTNSVVGGGVALMTMIGTMTLN